MFWFGFCLCFCLCFGLGLGLGLGFGFIFFGFGFGFGFCLDLGLSSILYSWLGWGGRVGSEFEINYKKKFRHNSSGAGPPMIRWGFGLGWY